MERVRADSIGPHGAVITSFELTSKSDHHAHIPPYQLGQLFPVSSYGQHAIDDDVLMLLLVFF